MEGSRIARPKKRSWEELEEGDGDSEPATRAGDVIEKYTLKVPRREEEPVIVPNLTAEQVMLMEEETVQLPCFEKTNGKQKIAFKIENRTFLKEAAVHAIKPPSRDTLLLLALYFASRWKGERYVSFESLHEFYKNKFLGIVSPHSRCEDLSEVRTHLFKIALDTKDVIVREGGVKLKKSVGKMFYEIIFHPEDSITADATLGILKGKMVLCIFGKHYIKSIFNF